MNLNKILENLFQCILFCWIGSIPPTTQYPTSNLENCTRWNINELANTKNVNFTSSEIAEKIWAAFLQIVISLSHFFTKKARGKMLVIWKFLIL